MYLVIEFKGLTHDDNTFEIEGRVKRTLSELFAHEKEFYGWDVNVEEWFEKYPVSRDLYDFWKSEAMTKDMEVKA